MNKKPAGTISCDGTAKVSYSDFLEDIFENCIEDFNLKPTELIQGAITALYRILHDYNAIDEMTFALDRMRSADDIEAHYDLLEREFARFCEDEILLEVNKEGFIQITKSEKLQKLRDLDNSN